LGKLIGIDLGTTKSCVAVLEGGRPVVIPNQEGERTTPSVVAFTPSGDRLEGQPARRQAVANPQNTVAAFKRLVGRKFSSAEVDELRRFAPYRLVEAPNGDVHIQIGGKVYSTPEITAFVIEKLKAAAEEYLGEEVTEAIITVPAYFNDPQRQATRDAARIAGLKVSRIVGEPTSAALVYALQIPDLRRGGSRRVAVYHLGGGTFDISIVDIDDGLATVQATDGDTFLGGEDFDHRIVDWLVLGFQRATGIDLRRDPVARERLKEAAEMAKCALSTVEEAPIALPFLSADASGPKHLETVLTRRHYESLTDDLSSGPSSRAAAAGRPRVRQPAESTPCSSSARRRETPG
jgi:molecular chaperone DnaK